MTDAGRKIIAEKKRGDKSLVLWEHAIDGKCEYELLINGVFIMASYNSLSSELLVRNAVNKRNTGNLSVLIGGLGLGYSVKEACLQGEKIRKITLVELDPDVIECNLTVLKELNGKYLADSRVELVNGDFIKYIHRTGDKFDIVCMDIDNGPMLIVNEDNEEAYSTPFFRRIRDVLRPEGIFAIWSCNEDSRLLADMRSVFGKCSVEEVRERHNGQNVSYYLYFAFADVPC